MDVPRTIEVTKDEADAAVTALDYYLDTLTECYRHEDGKHGDEVECEGWGPVGLSQLRSVYDKLGKASH